MFGAFYAEMFLPIWVSTEIHLIWIVLALA